MGESQGDRESICLHKLIPAVCVLRAVCIDFTLNCIAADVLTFSRTKLYKREHPDILWKEAKRRNKLRSAGFLEYLHDFKEFSSFPTRNSH